MRRKDREVTDFNEMVKMIDACEIMRLGLAAGDYPYIVPVNFAYRAWDGVVELYIHGAMAGRKYEMLRANPHCSFEMDCALGFDFIPERGDVTMRYTCVMGKAVATFLETREEKKSALDDIIMARRSDTANFAYNQAVIDHVAIIKLTVTEWSAKANPFPKSAAERLNSCD